MDQDYSSRNNIILLYPHYTIFFLFVKYIESLIEDVECRYHPVGCDIIRLVFDHEVGHQLDKLLGIQDIPKIRALYDSRTNDELTNAISGYAWKNDNSNRYSEMIAEAWAEYCNNPNPREIARVVGETIEAEYKKKFLE